MRRLLTLLAAMVFAVLGVPQVLEGYSGRIQDDVNGSCPPGFTTIAVVNNPKDQNGNGIVCQAPMSARTKTKSGMETTPQGKLKPPTATNQTKEGRASQPRTKQGKQLRIKDDVGGVCPLGFTPVSNAAGHPKDENANGLVCVKFE